MSAINQIKPAWYQAGIDLRVLSKLSQRAGKGWENGVSRRGGINTGRWIICHNQKGLQLRQILNLYDTEREFLND